jgi:biopolymer transport protein ExbB/TolQ
MLGNIPRRAGRIEISAILIAVSCAILLITILSLALKKGSLAANLLLDYSDYSIFPYPLTIQNATYIVFAIGLGDLFVRWRAAAKEHSFIGLKILPEDDASILQIGDLGPIRRRATELHDGKTGFLPYLIDISTTQLQATRSIDQAVSMLDSSLDLMIHEVDLRYQTSRYIAWLLPTIGFVGTIVGIAVALEFINPQHIDVAGVTGRLGVSFYTTLMALIVSAVLVFFQHIVQKKEETALNEAGKYCLKNLINRVYLPDARLGEKA